MEWEVEYEGVKKQKRSKGSQKSPQSLNLNRLLSLWVDTYQEFFKERGQLVTYFVTPTDIETAKAFCDANKDIDPLNLKPLIRLFLENFPLLPQARRLTNLYETHFAPSLDLFIRSLNDLQFLKDGRVGDWRFDPIDTAWTRR